MDPTLSPYGATGAPAQNNQLAMMLKQLLGNQQNQPGGATAPSPGQPGQTPGQPGQGGGQNNGVFGGAGNVIKGLFNPPPTSILGQGMTGVKNLFSPTQNASAMTPPGGQSTYEGNIPSPANPAGPGTMGIMPQPASTAAMAPASVTGGAGGMGAPAPDPTSFAGSPSTMGAGSMGAGTGDPTSFLGGNPAGPDAMTQALMTPPLANPAGFGGGATLSDMLML